MDSDDVDDFTLPTMLTESQTIISCTDTELIKSPEILQLSPKAEMSKRSEVVRWLENDLGIANAQFEENETVISILHNIMSFNKQRDVDVAQVIAQFNLKKHEYEMEGNRLATFIRRLGIGTEHLDTEFLTWLDTLAQINLILDLKSPTNTNFLLAVNHLQRMKMKIENEITAEIKLVNLYQKKTQSALRKSYELQKILTLSKENLELQEADILKQTKKMEFLPKKIEEYEQKLEKLKLKLTQAGYRPQIRHDALTKRNKDLIKITNEIKASQVTLDTFSNLPPDISIIKQKIEEVRKELYKVDAELKAKITSLSNY